MEFIFGLASFMLGIFLIQAHYDRRCEAKEFEEKLAKEKASYESVFHSHNDQIRYLQHQLAQEQNCMKAMLLELKALQHLSDDLRQHPHYRAQGTVGGMKVEFGSGTAHDHVTQLGQIQNQLDKITAQIQAVAKNQK